MPRIAAPSRPTAVSPAGAPMTPARRRHRPARSWRSARARRPRAPSRSTAASPAGAPTTLARQRHPRAISCPSESAIATPAPSRPRECRPAGATRPHPARHPTPNILLSQIAVGRRPRLWHRLQRHPRVLGRQRRGSGKSAGPRRTRAGDAHPGPDRQRGRASSHSRCPRTTFTDTDPLTWSATLGDGTDLPAWLHFDPTTLTFTGTPADADVGALTVAVIATDSAGLTGRTVVRPDRRATPTTRRSRDAHPGPGCDRGHARGPSSLPERRVHRYRPRLG